MVIRPKRLLRGQALHDLDARGVYADWLEEQGDPSAPFWRWAHATGSQPYELVENQFITHPRDRALDEITYEIVWAWARLDPDTGNADWHIRNSRAVLPPEVWLRLRGHRKHPGRYWKRYDTLLRAWNAAERAWPNEPEPEKE